MTRQELIDKLVSRKTKEISFNWAHLISSINSLSQSDKDTLILAVETDDPLVVGELILKYVNNDKQVKATIQVEKLIDNKDKVTLTEIAGLL